MSATQTTEEADNTTDNEFEYLDDMSDTELKQLKAQIDIKLKERLGKQKKPSVKMDDFKKEMSTSEDMDEDSMHGL